MPGNFVCNMGLVNLCRLLGGLCHKDGAKDRGQCLVHNNVVDRHGGTWPPTDINDRAAKNVVKVVKNKFTKEKGSRRTKLQDATENKLSTKY